MNRDEKLRNVPYSDAGTISFLAVEKISGLRLWIGSILTLLVPLTAGLLCGAKLPWVRGLVFGLMALAILVTGKQRRLPKWSAPALIGLSLWGLTGLLPLSWFQSQKWRLVMQDDFGITDAATLSPQPWVTLEAWTLLTGGIIWVFFCVGSGFRERHRRFLLRGLTLGITLMAMLALTMKWSGDHGFVEQIYQHLRDPRYPQQFGLFANRNNFAGICVTGFLLTIMMTLDAWQRGQYKLCLLIALCVTPNFIAVLESGSRGGVLLLSVGVLIWLLTFLLRRQSKQLFSVAAALVLVIGSFILLLGKPVVQRFIDTVQDNGLTKDARIHVFHDTLTMIFEHPYMGISLGNFENVFPQYQVYTNNYTRFIHPENDWLWLAAEAGLIGLLFLLSAFGILVNAAMRHGRIKASTADRHLRHAALIVAGITAIQGFIDTPAHLLANALTAILLLCLATQREKTATPAFSSRVTTKILLFSGALAISINSWCTGFSQPVWPSRSAAIQLRSKTQSLLNQEEPAAAATLISEAIAWEPLAWDGYFMRACVHLQMGHSPAIALQDFARARFLEPNSSHLCILEATLWLRYHPAYSVQAWREAMRREPAQILNLYHVALPQLTLHPELREGVKSLATTPELKIQFLASAGSPADFKIILDDLLREDTTLKQLSNYDLYRFFTLWNRWGDRDELLRQLKLNPIWRKVGWIILADDLAGMNNHKGAYEMALKYVTPQPGSNNPVKRDLETLRRAFLHNANDTKFAWDLFEALKASGVTEEALAMLAQVEHDAKYQRRALYEKALLHASKGDYVSAWQTIRTYANQ